MGEQKLDIATQVADHVARDRGIVLGLGEDEGALQRRLRVEGEAFGSMSEPGAYFFLAAAMSGASVAAWSKIARRVASRIAGCNTCASCAMVPATQVNSGVVPWMMSLRKST